MEPNKEDDESRLCAVISSSGDTSSSKPIFDTITFTVPKKEPVRVPNLFTPPPPDPYIPTPTAAMSKTNSMVSMLADDLQYGDQVVAARTDAYDDAPSAAPLSATGDSGVLPSTSTAHIAIFVDDEDQEDPVPNTILPFSEDTNLKGVAGTLENLVLRENSTFEADIPIDHSSIHEAEAMSSMLPNSLSFSSSVPEGIEATAFDENLSTQFHTVGSLTDLKPNSEENWKAYVREHASYFAWIPSEETQKVLSSKSSEILAGTYVPDKEHLTMPGILLEEDLVDKVRVNVERVFGSVEANQRKTFTADSVSQNDNGLRELIKLGCYRAAINLTKRLLTLYGQGPGKVGHYSKHTPHSLQIWFTRISLLVRIREFSTAESELAAFKGFDQPDMHFEYYPDALDSSFKGSLVPFHFRVLAAEVPQYMRKFNETINKLYGILFRVEQILRNFRKDGSPSLCDDEQVNNAIAIWKKREVRVLYSLANSSLFAKDYHNAYNFLVQLCEKDVEHLPQLKSALGRLFLQHGDIIAAEVHFREASELRSDSEEELLDSLIDSAVLAIAQNSFLDAIEFLKQGLMLQPENFMLINNLAVCHLYLGNLKESLALMETTVKQNLPQSLQENVILNLCSIYELENSDGSKKLELLKLISEYKGDGINLASLKIPGLI